jgi:hypothetical protein
MASCISIVELSEFTTFMDDIFTAQPDPIECDCVLPRLKPHADPKVFNDQLCAKRAYHSTVLWDIYIVLMATDKISPVYPMFESIYYASLFNLRKTELTLLDLQLYYKLIGFMPSSKPALYEFAFIMYDTRLYIAKIIDSKSMPQKNEMINQHAPLSKMISFCDRQIHATHQLLSEIDDLPLHLDDIARRLSLCVRNMNKVMKPIPKLSLRPKTP